MTAQVFYSFTASPTGGSGYRWISRQQVQRNIFARNHFHQSQWDGYQQGTAELTAQTLSSNLQLIV